MIRAVFFDAGHTVIRPEPSIGRVYQGVTRRFGVEVEPERFESLMGPIFRRHMPAGSESSDALDRALWKAVTSELQSKIPEMAGVEPQAWFEALYERFGEGSAWKMYDDVPEVLRELRRRGLKLGIVSNWDSRLRRIVGEIGLGALVDFVKISAEVGRRKPHRAIFEAALKEAGVRAEEALHVGDLETEDVKGAQGAGLGAVLIARHDGVFNAGGGGIRGLGELLPIVGGGGE